MTPRKKQTDAAAGAPAGRSLVSFARDRRFMVVSAVYLVICLTLFLSYFSRGSLRPGDVAGRDYVSSADVYFTDSAQTEAARRLAEEKEPDYYRVHENAREDIDELFQALIAAGGDPERRRHAVQKLKTARVSSRTARYLADLPDRGSLSSLRLHTYAILDQLAPGGLITERDLKNMEKRIDGLSASYEVGPETLAAIVEILRLNVARNADRDIEETERRRELARERTRPVKDFVRKGEVFLRRGERVSQHHIDVLRTLNMDDAATPWLWLAGFPAAAAFLMFLAAALLKNFFRPLYEDFRFTAILSILSALAFCATVGLAGRSGYLAAGPFGVLGIAGGFLLNAQAVLFIAPLVALLAASAPGLGAQHLVVAVSCAAAGAVFASRVRDKDVLIKSGLAVAAAGITSTALMSLLFFDGLKQMFMDTVFFGLINGLTAFIVSSGFVPALEKIFNITTPHRILELSNPEEPLLKRLLVEAPGTYHHSIFVGNLAETAAEAVGGDTLLVRIASYYHDVGKLKRPYFFAENQLVPGSHLAGVTPTLGALVISSHVKDGLEMAREQGLPKEITDMIPQSHGTNLISFFHQQAKAEAAEGESVPEEKFRYPGPKPQTLEAAILMLADSCEAAVRALKEPTAKAIETQVNEIARARLRDGQFDECEVTLKQIDTIRRSIAQTLARIYHGRIEYPKLREEIEKKQG